MLGTGFNQNKCKTQCQLCCGRIRLMRNKRNIQLKNSRKEVANLLRTGKAENARIRVETVMREEAMLQAYDVVELFVELLQVRVAIVDRSKELPPDMTEAVSSLIYAAARVTDLQELGAIKALLAAKFGKEYAAEAASDHLCRKWHVNDNLIRWLSIEAPTPEDKIACLTEIAQEHGVDWAPDGAAGPPGAKAYLSGDRTSYSDPLTPPSGGWGGNSGGGAASYGGSHAGGGARVTSIYDSEGPFGGAQPPPARRDAASGIDYDNDYTGSGRRMMAEQPPGGGGNSSFQPPGRKQPQPPPLQGSDDEDDGVVSYPAAGSAADAANAVEDEEDGVVVYPRAGGPADRFDEAAEFAKEQGAQPADRRRQQQDPSCGAGSNSGGAPHYQQQPSPQGSGGGGGGQWAPPPSPGSGQGRGFQSRIDAVGKWKARRDGSGGGSGFSGLGGSAHSQGADSSPAQDDAWSSRQAAYDSAPGPPKKPLAGPPPRPRAPPAAQQQQQQGAEEPTGNELDDLQKRFAALKQR